MMNDLRCNAGGARPIKVMFWEKAQGMDGATCLNVHALNNLNKGKYKANKQ